MKWHEDCAHVIHSHLVDEMTVHFFPFDSTNTIHRKTQEHCSEELIIHKLKQLYLRIRRQYQQVWGTIRNLHLSLTFIHTNFPYWWFGYWFLEVQALKTGVTIVKQFNYFWPKSLFEELWKETHVMADLVWAANCPKCGKPGFDHQASHYMDCITRCEYVIGGARPRARKGFRTPRKWIQNQPSVFKPSLSSYAEILKNNYKKC